MNSFLKVIKHSKPIVINDAVLELVNLMPI